MDFPAVSDVSQENGIVIVGLAYMFLATSRRIAYLRPEAFATMQSPSLQLKCMRFFPIFHLETERRNILHHTCIHFNHQNGISLLSCSHCALISREIVQKQGEKRPPGTGENMWL